MVPLFAVDLAALEAPGRWPTETHGAPLCAGHAPGAATLDGRPAEVLAVAAEIYSHKSGMSAWGHASLRFLACQDGALRDLEYELYRFVPAAGELLETHYLPGHPALSDRAWLRAQRGQAVLYRNASPVDAGFFADAAARNREIYELWLRVDPPARDAMLTALDAEWTGQIAVFDARGDLPRRYGPLDANCTTVLCEQVASVPPSSRPNTWFDRLFAADAVDRAVLYPSHAAARRLAREAGGGAALVAAWESGALAPVPRKHPVFRWHAGLPQGLSGALATADRAPLALPPPAP